MPGKVKVDGVWKDVAGSKVKVDGAWKDVAKSFTKVNGSWQQWYTAISLNGQYFLMTTSEVSDDLGSGGVGIDPSNNLILSDRRAIAAFDASNNYSNIFNKSLSTFDNLVVSSSGHYYTSFTGDFDKRDSSGNMVYSKEFPSTGSNIYVYSISVDSLDNLYASGYFQNSNPENATIAKVNSSGNLVWGKKISIVNETSDNYVQASAVDSSDNIIIGASSGTGSVHIIKLNGSGNVVWAKRVAASSGYRSVQKIVTDSQDNVYVKFDNSNLIKLSSNGSPLWQKSISSLDNIASDSEGNIYISSNNRILKMNTDGDTVWGGYFTISNFGDVNPAINNLRIVLDNNDDLFLFGDFVARKEAESSGGEEEEEEEEGGGGSLEFTYFYNYIIMKLPNNGDLTGTYPITTTGSQAPVDLSYVGQNFISPSDTSFQVSDSSFNISSQSFTLNNATSSNSNISRSYSFLEIFNNL